MCGIAGVVGDVDSNDRMQVRKMIGALRHRGPDEVGFHDAQSVCLGIARLSVIDVAHGQQPVTDDQNQIACVMNGEIYNHERLRNEIRKSGRAVIPGSDASCLPSLYEMFSDKFVENLRGMFAIALWDENSQRLILVRDRLGKKPLYYFESQGKLWFASEINALLGVAKSSLEVDRESLQTYLRFGYIPQPSTIYRDIRSLSPATLLEWSREGISGRRYWVPNYSHDSQVRRSEEDLKAELRDLVLDATRVRLESERPLGVFLSGGLDSAAVLAAAHKCVSGPISTFTIGFSEAAHDESQQALELAQFFGTRHHELRFVPEIEKELPLLVAQFGQPFADATALPTNQLSRFASDFVVVALNGDGGDEAFGGYSTYKHFHNFLPGNYPRVFTPEISRNLAQLLSAIQGGAGRTRRAVKAFNVLSYRSQLDRYAELVSTFTRSERHRLMGSHARDFTIENEAAPIEAGWKLGEGSDWLNQVLSADVHSHLPGALLPKVDITTMANSLEARSPLLDQELFSWCARLSGDLKIRDGVSKFLFKGAMEAWLPVDVIYRQKRGFHAPVDSWLTGGALGFAEEILLEPGNRLADYLELAEVRRTLTLQRKYGHSGQKVWNLLVLALWLRMGTAR